MTSLRVSGKQKVLLLTAALLLLVALVVPATALAAHPSRYLIRGVPEIGQLDYSGCGSAALAMQFSYWGPRVDYKEIVDVTRTMSRGGSLPDMARGGQFSFMSDPVSDAYPGYQPFKGYAERKLGYGSFFFASTTSWFDQLKDIIAQGYPVQVLTDWTPTEVGPHYRVVVGYDDVKQVVYLNDPWPYGPWLDQYKKPGYKGWTWPYVTVPWKVTVRAPDAVTAGKTFTVKVKAKYRCPAPFGQGPEVTFPTFPASSAKLALVLPKGFRAVGSRTAVIGSGTLLAGASSQWQSFTVRAPQKMGTWRLRAKGSGLVSGSVPLWGTVYWNAPYDYTDCIGGFGGARIRVN
jgi:hypothetical protein